MRFVVFIGFVEKVRSRQVEIDGEGRDHYNFTLCN